MSSIDEILGDDEEWSSGSDRPATSKDSDGFESNDTFPEEDDDPDFIIEKSKKSPPIGTALSSFQRAAERFPPLTSQEQNELAALYKSAMKAKENLSNLKGKDKREAEQLIIQSKNAMEHLCASCWKLAWMIVREQSEKRFGKERATPLLPDLMAEANSALVLSVNNFDPLRIPTFHTYAAQVVRDHIRAVLARDSYLQLAPSWNRLKRIAIARLPELISELGRNPSKEELQNDLLAKCLIWADEHLTVEQKKLPESQQTALKMAKLRKQGMLGALRDIDQVLIATQNVSSLDMQVSEDGGATLGDLLVHHSLPSVHETVEQNELKNTMYKALSVLSEREREILVYRYGLMGAEELKYNQIAEKFDISAERVRQVERTALAKLASPHGQFASLAEFLPSKLDAELESRGF